MFSRILNSFLGSKPADQAGQQTPPPKLVSTQSEPVLSTTKKANDLNENEAKKTISHNELPSNSKPEFSNPSNVTQTTNATTNVLPKNEDISSTEKNVDQKQAEKEDEKPKQLQQSASSTLNDVTKKQLFGDEEDDSLFSPPETVTATKKPQLADDWVHVSRPTTSKSKSSMSLFDADEDDVLQKKQQTQPTQSETNKNETGAATSTISTTTTQIANTLLDITNKTIENIKPMLFNSTTTTPTTTTTTTDVKSPNPPTQSTSRASLWDDEDSLDEFARAEEKDKANKILEQQKELEKKEISEKPKEEPAKSTPTPSTPKMVLFEKQNKHECF